MTSPRPTSHTSILRSLQATAYIPVLFLAILLSGCGKPAGQTVQVVLFDASPSTHKAVIHRLYQESAATIIAAAKPGDALVAYPVTSNSQASSFAELTVRFPTYNGFEENKDQFDAEQHEAQAQA